MKQIRLDGLTAAAFTPMDDKGGLALERVDDAVTHAIAQGCTGLYVCGSTGEWASLSTSERKQVATAYVAAASGRVPVIVQVGDYNLFSACELAAHAAAIGADAISASAPSYYPARCPDTLMTCMARIAAHAPDLPFYYYHIPALAPTAVDAASFLSRARKQLPNLAGIKYSGSDLSGYLQLTQQAGDEFDILFGCDEIYLQGLCSGAAGAIGSTYNFMGRLYLAIRDAFQAADFDAARQLQERAVRIVNRIVEGPQPHAGLKAAMAISGCDCGPVRLPQRPLSAAEHAQLASDLESLGFFEWITHNVRAEA